MITLQRHLRDLAVQNMNGPGCLLGNIVIVGNEDNGIALLMKLMKNI